MVTAGLSTVRILIPVVLCSLLGVALSFSLSETVVPEATRRRDDILESEVHKRIVRKPTEYSNLTVLGHDGRIYSAKLYLVPERRMHDVTVTEFKGDAISRRIDARTARWDETRWVFEDGVTRTFKDGKETAQSFALLPLPDLPERPEDFTKESQDPDQMGYADLKSYVARMRQSGLRVEKYLVALHLKLAFPFINLIVVVMGAALASRLRSANAAVGFGVCVLTAFFYYGLMRAGQALGENGTLPPWIAAWSANVLFGSLAIVLLLRAQRR
jgi:lipopolysaccharide export system permease protein